MGDVSIMKYLPSKDPSGVARLLIPIDATDESRWGVRYAIGRAQGRTPVEVSLLFMIEPAKSMEILRFRTEEEIRKFSEERSAIFLEEAAKALREAGVPHQVYCREGDVVQGVMAFAEEQNCLEIVVPRTAWLGVFPHGLGRKLLARKCTVPLVQVGEDGELDG